MALNANDPFNAQIRNAGNRSRAIPNIGQTPVGPSPMPQASPIPQAPQAPVMPNPMAAPRVQGSTFTMHPQGTSADPNQYNYEPQPDGSWRVYPPGVNAPPHMLQASLPRAASTGDYMRMARSFGGALGQAPTPATPPLGGPPRPPGM